MDKKAFNKLYSIFLFLIWSNLHWEIVDDTKDKGKFSIADNQRDKKVEKDNK